MLREGRGGEVVDELHEANTFVGGGGGRLYKQVRFFEEEGMVMIILMCERVW